MKVLMRNQTTPGSHGPSQPPKNRVTISAEMSVTADVLADQEQAELHARVLGVVAGDELALGLDEVERDAPRLGEPGDEEDDEADELREDVVDAALLRLDDVGQAEGARERDHADEREAHEDLVAHHLRGGAQPADQGVLAARRPAGEHHAVHGQRRHGEEEEEPDVEVGDDPALGDRDDDEGEQRRDQHQGRRDHEHPPVGERRRPVFLEEDLERVGEHLQQAGRADPVGAVAVLDEAEQPALVPDQAGGDGEHDDEHEQHREQLPVPGGGGDERAGREEGAHDGVSRRARRARAGSEMKGTPGRPTGTPAVPVTSEGTSAQRRRASIHGSQSWSQSPSSHLEPLGVLLVQADERRRRARRRCPACTC